MAKSNFYLKSSQHEERLIYLFFSYDGKRLKYSTEEKVNPRFWNEKDQRVRRSDKNYKLINDWLDNLENKAHEIYKKYRNEEKPLNNTTFRNELDDFTNRKPKEPEIKVTLFLYIDTFISNKEAIPDGLKKKPAPKTIAYYKRVRDILKEYQESKNLELDFDGITDDFYTDFMTFLDEKGYSKNYKGNVIKTLKTFLNQATKDGINSNLAFKHFEKLSESGGNKIYLSENELITLYEFPFAKEKHQKVRDLFLIGAYTGLRFSDFSNLTPQKIKVTAKGTQVFKVEVQKNKKRDQTLTIPIHPIVKAILKKRGWKLPKPMSNQKFNDYIKEVCQIAEINGVVEITDRKTREKASIPKCEGITSHAARRSFCTNAYLAGCSSLAIMSISGHTTEKSFLEYINITDEENAERMAEHTFFQPQNV